MKKKKYVKKKPSIVKTAMTNLIGIGLIGATSSMHSNLPAGTAKNITGIVPGLQATALATNNLKHVVPRAKPKRRKKK